MNEPVWYKQVWPWVIIAIPFSAVLFGIFQITVVILHPDDVVDDNYYKDGMAINQTLDEDRAAKKLGVTASLAAYTKDEIALIVHGTKDSRLTLKFAHITDASKDRQVILYRQANDRYAAYKNIPQEFTRPGVWYVELDGQNGDWRLWKRMVTPLVHLDLAPQ